MITVKVSVQQNLSIYVQKSANFAFSIPVDTLLNRIYEFQPTPD